MINVASLFVAETATKIFERALELASTLGLPVSSWRVGDPTRTMLKHASDTLATREELNAEYVKAGFLSSAEGDWLTLRARDVYGVDRVEATYAEATCELTNSGAGLYVLAAGDLIVVNSTTGKTYRNTEEITISPSSVLAGVKVAADEAGSDSNAGIDEIDDLGITLLGVSVTASSVAVASDAQPDGPLRDQCAATLGALSPNGPADAYVYVARNADLTGADDITRAATAGDSATGTVTVWVAGATGTVPSASVAAAQSAIDEWATPLCITATVHNTTAQAVAVTGTVDGTDIPSGWLSSVTSALTALLKDIPIGGMVARSAIVTAIHSTLEDLGASQVSVVLSAPASDLDVADDKVITLGTVTLTEI